MKSSAFALAALFLGLCLVVASAIVCAPASGLYFAAGILLWLAAALLFLFGRS